MNATPSRRAGLAGALIATALAAGTLGLVAGRTLLSPAHPSAAPAAAPAADAGRRILYYRNPMGLSDTSPVPKKDSMGMDYVPVYADEAPATAAPNAVTVSAEKIQKLGVESQAAVRRTLSRALRAVGTLQYDERSQHVVAPRFEGWIEKLHVNATGQAVTAGQPLMDVYGPELVSAQREYLIARAAGKTLAATEVGAGYRELGEASLERLRNWQISPAQLRQLAETGEVRRSMTLVAPASGVVVDKPAIAGKRFMAGEPLLQIASTGTVWMVADVFEQDLGRIAVGQPVTFRVDAYPERSFAGKVTFIAPALSAETRTARVRIELPNPQGVLRPMMFGTAEFSVASTAAVVAVPESAVIDSGRRQIVLVDAGGGRFSPREVRTGFRGDGLIEIAAGLEEGERVVVRANFLIDSESNLRAALGSFAAPPAAAAAPAPAAPVVHQGSGRIEAVDAKGVTISHGPIPSLRWPAMTMPLAVADPALLRSLKPGDEIGFELREQDSGEFAIVRVVTPAAKQIANPSANPMATPASPGGGAR